VDAAGRRQAIQLGVLGVILAGVVYFVLWPAMSPTVVVPGPAPIVAGKPGAKTTGKPADVRLESLGKAVDLNEDGPHRNPFRMGAATVPVPEGTMASRQPTRPVTPVVPVETGPPPPPPLPPIPYRFIGVLSGVPGQGKIAVLTDGRTVVHGRVNAEIEGRYRIVQIGEESLQMEYLDGRGRQTIRLLGQ
jgi:hypothetical protein